LFLLPDFKSSEKFLVSGDASLQFDDSDMQQDFYWLRS